MSWLLLPYLLVLTSAAPAPKKLAYYCASGWRVKYHRTPRCRGLELCSATVKPMSWSQARGQMDPCKMCN